MQAKRVVGTTVLIVSVLVGFYFLFRIREILILVLVSILLAAALEPGIKGLQRLRLGRGLSILLIYVAITVAVALIALAVIPVITSEVSKLIDDFPRTLARWESYAYLVQNRLIRQALTSLFTNLDKLLLSTPGLAEGVFSVTISVAGTIFAIVTVFVITYYWLTERAWIKRVFVSLFPLEKRPTVRLIWDDVELKLGGWVRGQLVLCAAIGAGAAIGFLVLGVKYALILALLAAVAELIPFVGPYIGFTPAFVMALTQSPQLGIFVGIYCVVIQLVEANVLVPRVMHRAVGISPLTVILGMLVGFSLFGIVGALLAVPVAGAIQIALQHVIRTDDEAVAPPEQAAAPVPVADSAPGC